MRSGSNELRVETGRPDGLERGESTCWFGCEKIDDEQHSQKACGIYEDLREEVMKGVVEEKFQEKGLERLMGKGSR